MTGPEPESETVSAASAAASPIARRLKLWPIALGMYPFLIAILLFVPGRGADHAMIDDGLGGILFAVVAATLVCGLSVTLFARLDRQRAAAAANAATEQ